MANSGKTADVRYSDTEAKKSDVRFRCLVVYQNGTMTFFSTEVVGALRYRRHASDTEQTSVTSRHRRCWASADSVTHVCD